MNFILYPILLLLSAILFSGCKGQAEVAPQWTTKPIEVDGNMADWAGITTTYFEGVAVQLGLCNDNDRLYILFRFNNQTYSRLIGIGGLTLWLDNAGGKKKDFGFRYSGGPARPMVQDPGMSGEGGFLDRLTPEQKERLAQQTAETDRITVVGGEHDMETILPIDGTRGPAVAFAELKGMYTYEFSIPLKKTDLVTYGIDSRPGETLSLGLEWGLSDEERRRMMEEMGAGRGGGMMGGGGQPGGGTGGRPPGGGMGGPGGMTRPQMPGKQEVWVKTMLASPPNGQDKTDGDTF